MTDVRVYIAGMGITSCLGAGVSRTRRAIQKGLTGIRPLSLFPTASNKPLPAGQASIMVSEDDLPRTHQLARMAADEAMANSENAPDAVIMGVTTGGMLTTEGLLKNKVQDLGSYRLHATGSVAVDIALRHGCTGPALTVSTACSSGAAAIKIALEMLRSGNFKRVLAGGADSLCRLTYFGFNSLQLVDPEGARPLDENRRGMSVAEGAAALLLVANDPANAVAEVCGAGISCDGYHPAKPHPEGHGAMAAMQSALDDAGLAPDDINYINLHGTGTFDNDISEARAIDALFSRSKPLVSSVKGAFGHTLAAAGALEAVVVAIGIADSLVPANVGCRQPDPDLKLDPVRRPFRKPIETVLSNSFGFGGNNAAVVLSACDRNKPGKMTEPSSPMTILGTACLTGAGRTGSTISAITEGRGCAGMLDLETISADLSPGQVRRLKRFPRLALSLAVAASEDLRKDERPSAVFLGTGWGALSETSDFLRRLFESDEQYPSPTDFVGSVHNAAAGQIAMQSQATGANITMTGGDYSFEQALMTAGLLSKNNDGPFLVIGADEFHPDLARLFDRSVAETKIPSDGGGAFCLTKGDGNSGLTIQTVFYESSRNHPEAISKLIQRLGQSPTLNKHYGMILAGIPAACRSQGEYQMQTLLELTGYQHPVIDYRRLTGEHASASAVAAVMAVRFLQEGKIPAALRQGKPGDLRKKGALIIGTGEFITAVEVMKR